MQVEAELARREADLESLQAQLAKLKDVTDLATIEVTLVSPDRVVQPPTDEDDDLGFASGLRGGWDAFAGIALVVADRARCAAAVRRRGRAGRRTAAADAGGTAGVPTPSAPGSGLTA